MSSLPFFSVVIPTYNRKNAIKKAIDSVLTQSFQDFEIIVIDNGSTDGTRQFIQSYSNAKIKYFYQIGSGSPASPRNAGIRESLAPWICFLDSDDYWLPNKLEAFSQAIKVNKNADVFYHYETMLNQSTGKETLLSHHRRLDNMYKDMLEYGNQLSTSATTIRKSFLSDHQLFFNESHDFDIVEDYDLWLRIANKKADFTARKACKAMVSFNFIAAFISSIICFCKLIFYCFSRSKIQFYCYFLKVLKYKICLL